MAIVYKSNKHVYSSKFLIHLASQKKGLAPSPVPSLLIVIAELEIGGHKKD